MKRLYIAPQTDIETLHLEGSVLQDYLLLGHYSDYTDTVRTNESIFETEESGSSSNNLWDE